VQEHHLSFILYFFIFHHMERVKGKGKGHSIRHGGSLAEASKLLPSAISGLGKALATSI
jgi:hypothetical protein